MVEFLLGLLIGLIVGGILGLIAIPSALAHAADGMSKEKQEKLMNLLDKWKKEVEELAENEEE